MSGFAVLFRDVADHHLFRGDSQRLGAWAWLILKACWKATPFDISGKTVMLERGQICVSRSQMADAWGMKPSAVERFLTRLQTEQMIERATGQGRTIITICNYDKYQDISDGPGQVTGQATGQPSDSHRTAKEQGNKGTREPIGSHTPLPPKQKSQSATTKIAMTDDWMPATLPASVQVLVDMWPPGRLSREIDQFRDYWIERREKRPGWDSTFHNRIRDIHDRVLRDNKHGTYRNDTRDTRDGFQRHLDEKIERFAAERASREAGRSDDDDASGILRIPLHGART